MDFDFFNGFAKETICIDSNNQEKKIFSCLVKERNFVPAGTMPYFLDSSSVHYFDDSVLWPNRSG